jgi:hypothetical protein
MGGGFAVDVNGLDACRATMSSEAGHFGGIGDGLSEGPADGSSFGGLSASARLSQLTTQMSAASASQYSSAEAFLRATERALDQVRQNYALADGTNADNARSI